MEEQSQSRGRCTYCNSVCSGDYCSEECREAGEKFRDYQSRWYKKSRIFMAISILAIIPVAFLFDFSMMFIGILVMLVGVLMYLFPFASEEKYAKKGMYYMALRRSNVSMLLMGAGAAMMILNSLLLYTGGKLL